MLKSKNDVFPPRSIAPGNSPLQGRKSPIRPQDARRKIESRKLPQNVLSLSALKQSARFTGPTNILPLSNLTDTASALSNDVDEIYAYVRQLKFCPTYGSQRGPMASLGTGYANSFDAADLMMQLCVAAGYEAKIVFGDLKMTGPQVGAWLGTDPTNVWAARNMFANGGIPTDAYWDPAVFDYFVEVSHCWVTVKIDGVWYQFDPSYKTYTATPGVDLETIIGYDQTAFETAALAGSTSTADYLQNINATGIATKLNEYEANLIDWINTNQPDASFEDLIGKRTLDAEVTPVRNAAHPLLKAGTTPVEWTAIPNAYKTTLRVQYDTIDETFYSSDIAISRLTLFFNSSLEAELRLDGTLLGTSTAQGVGTWNSVLLTIDHPYADPWADQSFYQRIWAGQYYLIGQSWGNSSADMAYLHQKLLQESRSDGLGDTSEAVLGEALCVLWHTWNAEKTITSEVAARLNNCGFVLHHQVGIVGHGEAPSMDLGGIVWSTSANDNDYTKVAGTDYVIAMRGIGFESAAISQIPGVGGVSSNTILSQANDAGQKIYFADSTNWATNVRPNLVNYTTQMLDDLENWYINWDWKLLIHEDGATNQGDYEGYGIYAISPWGGCVGLINGYLLGGYGQYAQGAWDNSANASSNQLAIEARNDFKRVEVGEHNEVVFDWVVNLFQGSAEYSHTEFVSGNGKFPFCLPFTRYYSSANRGQITEMGKGWRHSYMIDAQEGPQAFNGLGAADPRNAAGNLSQMVVAILQSSGYSGGRALFAFTFVSTTEANKKLTGNVVTVRNGDKTYTFSALSDGTYLPPKGLRFGLALVATDPLLPYYQMQSYEGDIYKFNPGRKVEKITFNNGVVLDFTYAGPDNHLTSVHNSMGESLMFNHVDVGGLLYYVASVVSSRAGTIASYSINTGNAVLNSYTDRKGYHTDYTYDGQARLVGYNRPGGSYSASYFDDGRVRTLSGPGSNTEYSYAGSGPNFTVSTNGPLGITQTIFNEDGTPSQIRDNGLYTSHSYDGRGRVVRTSLPHGETQIFAYDEWDRVTSKVRSGAGILSGEAFSYGSILSASWDKWTTYTNPRGQIFTRSYDGRGSITGETGPSGSQTWVNDSRGLPISHTDQEGMVTTFSYSGYGDLTGTTIDAGGLNLGTIYAVDIIGDRYQTTDPRGNIFGTSHDTMRHVTGESGPLGQSAIYTVDDAGNRTGTKRALLSGTSVIWQTYGTLYSSRNLPLVVSDPLGHVTTTTWGRDLPGLVTDAMGKTRGYGWTSFGKLMTITDANGVLEEQRTYLGPTLTSIKDARGNITYFNSDGIQRITKQIYPDGTYETWTYDNNSNVTSYRSRAGIVTTQVFDGADRLTSKKVGTEPTQTFTSDNVGRLLTASTPIVAGDPSSGTFSRAYDSAGRLISETNPQGEVIGYELDRNGNVTKVTHPDGYYVQYAYDALNRVTSIKLNGSAADAVSFTYDTLSRRTSKTYANGNTIAYGFDIADRLTSRSLTHAGGTATWGYGHNDVNQITSQTISDAAFEWTPAAASSVSYGTPNNLNQYPTVGGATQSHTTDGQLLSDAVWTYQYDGEGMLIAANKTGVAASFKYDPFSRLIERTVNTNKTRYVYAGSRLLEEYDSATNILLKRYVYAGTDEAVIEIDGAGNVTYLHQDHQNSLIARANGAGTLTAKYEYSPWGEASLPGTGFGYTGQRWDADLGLYNYKARYYDPVKGRFLQPDPVGYKQDMNLYTYCVNDRVP